MSDPQDGVRGGDNREERLKERKKKGGWEEMSWKGEERTREYKHVKKQKQASKNMKDFSIIRKFENKYKKELKNKKPQTPKN